MALHKLVRSNYGWWKLARCIKYENLYFSKEGLILLIQSILETKRILHLHGSTLFTIPLKQRSTSYTSNNRINVFIFCELDTWSRDLNFDFTLTDRLFGGVKLAKTVDPDKYVYSDYGIGFDSRSQFPLPDGSIDKNVIIFGVDMSSTVHIDNKGKNILIPGIDQTQGSDDTTLALEVQYSVNISRSNINFCLSLHYNGINSFLFNATKVYQFKAKSSEMKKMFFVFRKPFRRLFN